MARKAGGPGRWRAAGRAYPEAMRRTLRTLPIWAAVLALGWAAVAAQTAELEIAADAEYARAEGGSTALEIRAAGGGLSAGDRVSLTSTLGAFGGESGPSRASLRLRSAGDGGLVASVRLFGDGRAGDAVVAASAGGLRATARVGFAGEPAELRAVGVGGAGGAFGGDLFAAEVHELTVEARDAGGRPVPGAEVSWEVTRGAALLEGGSAEASSTAGADGRASALLEGPPGEAELTARSGRALLRLALRLHEPAAGLEMIRLSKEVLQRGSMDDAGSVLILLTDAAGRGTPGQAVSISVERASSEGASAGAAPRLVSDEAGGRFRTDAQGQILAHVDATGAAGGEYAVRAAWRHGGLRLEAVMPVTVAGLPSALYLKAMELEPPSADAPEAYTVLASVADGSGRPVADGYHVRWSLSSAPRGSSISTALSPVSGGEARAVLTPGAGAEPAEVELRAWLLEAPRVSASALLANVTGEGTALRRGVNRVIWRGERTYIHEAMAPIAHVGGTAWRLDERGEWVGYELRPGAEDFGFAVEPGDELRIRVESAVLLPRVSR